MHPVRTAIQLLHGGNELRFPDHGLAVFIRVRLQAHAQRIGQALLKHVQRFGAAGGHPIALTEGPGDRGNKAVLLHLRHGSLKIKVGHAVILYHGPVQLLPGDIQIGCAGKEQYGQFVLGNTFGKNRHNNLRFPISIARRRLSDNRKREEEALFGLSPWV